MVAHVEEGAGCSAFFREDGEIHSFERQAVEKAKLRFVYGSDGFGTGTSGTLGSSGGSGRAGTSGTAEIGGSPGTAGSVGAWGSGGVSGSCGRGAGRVGAGA